MSKTYLIGWVSQAVRTHLLQAPEAPSNYKDPVKIREYKDAALERLTIEATQAPVVATLVAVRIEELSGAEAFQQASTTPGVVSHALMEWMVRDDTEVGMLYGFDAEVLLEMAAMECLANVMNRAEPMRLPYSLWKDTGYIKDPFKMLCRTETRRFIGLPQLVKFLLGRDFNPAAFVDPREQINLARLLARQGQLPATGAR